MSRTGKCDVCGASKNLTDLFELRFQDIGDIGPPRFDICHTCLRTIRAQRIDGVTDLREIAKGLVLAAFQDAVA